MKMNKLTVWLMTGLISLASFVAVADDKGKWQGGCPDWGSGMMGPGMMGPDMMGHGYGMRGPGMMRGYGPMWLPDLKEDQQKKISAIYEESHKKRWDLMTKMQGEYATLRGLYAADKRDPAAIGNQYKQISDLRRQMVELSVDASNRMEAVLTKEQKERLRSYGPGWMMDE
ncbi:Spy/CpxP family protein refolding chaperone [Sulfuricella sp.]|uniref:Spy/CpxP family protein refolding chaperone n=1 Tax=Sulfuricella sp. TaxID=2099377 RepID=UPI002C1127DF|nr:Spy/CpxP family protein refolding chaperone [Sulfuricella sp.]HUX64437.1 Spy/CpxP family protein refolding chaperone [Sulfuricella sp.]